MMDGDNGRCRLAGMIYFSSVCVEETDNGAGRMCSLIGDLYNAN
jgi:hypothetical protein